MIVANFSALPLDMGPVPLKYAQTIHELLRESVIRFVAGTMSFAIKASGFKVIEDFNKMPADADVQREIADVDLDYIRDKPALFS